MPLWQKSDFQMKKVLFIFIFVFIFSFAFAKSDKIIVSSYVDKTELSIDDNLILTVEIESEKNIKTEPTIPQLTQFQVVSQSSSSSTSIEFVNGKYSKSFSKKFIYTLRPLKTGEFTIPSILVKYRNKEYHTKTIKVKIKPSRFNVTPKVTSPKGTGREIFLEAVCSKKVAYIGEPIIVTYKLYSRKNLVGINAEQFPEFSGFIKEETYQAQSISYHLEVKNGLQYYCYKISEFTLFPTHSEKFVAKPMELICEYNVQPKSFFDFGTTKRVNVRSNKLIIDSKDLPIQNQPADFSGAVGEFHINSNLNTTQVKAGESVTLTVTISGKGNIKMFEPPSFPKINNIDTFPPEISDILTDSHKTQGKKVIKYILIPNEPGDYKIPELTFSYFDPEQKQYKRISTDILRFNVQKGNKIVSKQYYRTPKGIDIQGLDICFIRTENSIEDFSFVFQNFVYWLLVFISLLSILLAHIYHLERKKRFQDRAYLMRRMANRILQKDMVKVKKSISEQKVDKFFMLAENALKNYIANKFNISLGTAKIKDIIEVLHNKGADKRLINDVKNFLVMTDQARFGGTKYNEEKIRAELTNLDDIIHRISKVKFRRDK